MPRQLKYNQAIAKALISNADGIIEAIDKYLAKADDELSDVLADEGYADVEDSVKAINAMQEEIAETLQNQTDDLVEALAAEQDSGWAAAQKKVSEMLDGDDIAEQVQEAAADMFQTEVPKLATVYMQETDGDLVVDVIRQRTKAGLPHGANGWDS